MADIPVVHVVDDDEAVRDSLMLLLEAAGMAVRTLGAGRFGGGHTGLCENHRSNASRGAFEEAHCLSIGRLRRAMGARGLAPASTGLPSCDDPPPNQAGRHPC